VFYQGKHRPFLLLFSIICFFLFQGKSLGQEDSLDALRKDFKHPPQSAGVRCFWWWLNSNVTKEAITRDLEQMKAKGFSGALIFDAGGAEQRGNHQVPAGPLFASPQWRELFVHAVKEAHRLGLELSLNITSGWNVGGPMVTPDTAAKTLTWSEIQIEGPTSEPIQLPMLNGLQISWRFITHRSMAVG